jgi:hypothetical protein
MTPEGRVKKEVSKYLKDHGIYYFMPVQTGYGATTLDYLCCWRGRFVGIECKAGKNKLSARQTLVGEQIRAAGGHTFIVDDIIDSVPNQMERLFSERVFPNSRS